MTIDLARLLIDFGFVILIWAVQLVIYPSFEYYSQSNLFTWHRKYTFKVTFIVLPLMFGQLILAVTQLWYMQNWYTMISVLCIVVLWLQTFLIFVPLHQSIDHNSPVENVCRKLTVKNWMRTTLWTALFFISLYYYILKV
jgi:hypothetical protein